MGDPYPEGTRPKHVTRAESAGRISTARVGASPRGYVRGMSAMSTVSRLLDRATRRVESASVLDPLAERIQGITGLLPAGPVKDVLSGTPVGHPVHPVAVMLPLGTIGSAALLDLVTTDEQAVRLLTTTGLVGAIPAVVTGWSDWNETQGAERRVGLVHAGGNAAGLALVAASLLTGRASTRRALTVSGLAVLGAAGWLGGHLAYALGVGVDTTAFQKPPTEWVDACGQDDLEEDRPFAVTVEDTPVLVLRHAGTVVALGDRCTHRGAPLHEGEVVDGCVECPWHGSRFDLTDGSVVRGPATRPQPTFEVRTSEGRVQVRRDEERSLRTNPTS